MLVLNFKSGERAVVRLPNGDNAIVGVLQCSKSGKVSLGFDFPLDCMILRETLVDRFPIRTNRESA